PCLPSPPALRPVPSRTMKKTRRPAPSRAKKSTRTRSATSAAPAGGLAGELRQLTAIRAQFHAIPRDTAASLLAQHVDAPCRPRALDTRAKDTFSGAMAWARVLGENVADRGLRPVLVRWFLDCLTNLGTLLAGHHSATNPTLASALEDANHA